MQICTHPRPATAARQYRPPPCPPRAGGVGAQGGWGGEGGGGGARSAAPGRATCGVEFRGLGQVARGVGGWGGAQSLTPPESAPPPRSLSAPSGRRVVRGSPTHRGGGGGRGTRGARGARGARMEGPDSPAVRDLVLLGGGHAHVGVLRAFGMRPEPGLRVTLVTQSSQTPYSGMLPGYVAGHYTAEECHIDLAPLARWAGASLVVAEACGLDPEARQLHLRGRPALSYDLISIDIGSTPAQDSIPGSAEHATGVKPVSGFVARWQALQARASRNRAHAPKVVVVGGGAGGVEIALALEHRMNHGPEAAANAGGGDEGRVEVAVCTAGEVMAQHNAFARRTFRRVLRDHGVTLHEFARVKEVRAGELVLEGGGAPIPFDECLWCTQASAAPWLRETGLALDGGFISVNNCLQSVSHPEVFAAGDVASNKTHPRPKAGVFAVRAGMPLAENIRRAAQGRSLKPWSPQTSYLSLISTGDKYCIGTKGPWGAEGAILWKWKDYIDRKFMDTYGADLPEMPTPKLSVPEVASAAGEDALLCLARMPMRCGGCGAKVGATTLSRVLDRLKPRLHQRSDIVAGVDSPDDAALVRPPGPGHLLVQTVDFFRSFISDPYVFGQVAAVHALGDCHAMGAEATSALAVAVVPYGLEGKMEETLFQMLAGACEALGEAGCTLAGGHSGEGREMALGFTINGTVQEKAVLRKSGVSPGYKLLLTKAIGTGVIFAADMRAKAKGTWVDGALSSMKLQNAKGAECLREHGARACTDVTGFGLLGHLVEMVKPDGMGARVDLAAIPMLAGSEECVTLGVFSSLQPENARLSRAVVNHGEVSGTPRYPLLFDPQTAGGLLAAVPAESAANCVEALRCSGYPEAAIIGEVVPLDDPVRSVTVSI